MTHVYLWLDFGGKVPASHAWRERKLTHRKLFPEELIPRKSGVHLRASQRPALSSPKAPRNPDFQPSQVLQFGDALFAPSFYSTRNLFYQSSHLA